MFSFTSWWACDEHLQTRDTSFSSWKELLLFNDYSVYDALFAHGYTFLKLSKCS